MARPLDNVALSSSPAFGTPLHPIPPAQRQRPPPPPAFKPPAVPTILPILLPPPTLRPLAFRTFTKKHNLTLNSSALQALATFIGRHCGSGWREEGTGEKVLEEVARLWKAESGGVIVEDGPRLRSILKTLEGGMSGGRIGPAKSNRLGRESSFTLGSDNAVDLSDDVIKRPSAESRQNSYGLSNLHVQDAAEAQAAEEEEETSRDPRAWLKVLSAFDQPRFTYDPDKKHFVQLTTKPSLFPPPSHKTALFRHRYHLIHQRLLRNEAFQAPSFSSNPARLSRTDTGTTPGQFYKITPIANLLGRGGTGHLLLGMLVVAPTGTLAINDLTGSIFVDLSHASLVHGPDSAYFCPGMIVLVDGVYEEAWAGAGSSGLGNTGGVGGTIGGRFVGFSIGGPPVERRNRSLGVDLKGADVSGGFGWTDFLGLGSERAVGQRMRRLERRLLAAPAVSASPSAAEPESDNPDSPRHTAIILAELHLDNPTVLTALRDLLTHYTPPSTQTPPLAFILCGNFSSRAALAGTPTDSIAYKDLFDALAAVLADFPALLRSATWVFVPGDHDPWASAFTAGASTAVPRAGVPEVFTSRIRRVFAAARAEGAAKGGGGEGKVEDEAVWTSNPARVCLFGPAHEIVVFRDDVSGRLRRNAVRIGDAVERERGGGGGGGGDAGQEGRAGAPAPGREEMMADAEIASALPSTDDVVPHADAAADPLTSASPLPHPPHEPAPALEDPPATALAKRLTLSLLPQSTLAPFPLALRPCHWDYAASALGLYPLPHTLVLADAGAPAFAVTFEGCHVLNPGRFVEGSGGGGEGGGAGAGGEGRRGRRRVQWGVYDLLGKRGVVRGAWV